MRHLIDGMLAAMRQLFSIITDAAVIWSRNFTLMYVLLLSSLLLEVLVPRGEMPAVDWRWLLLALVLVLTFAALMAGWFSMIATACTRYLEQSDSLNEKPPSPTDPFTLFKDFFPGIARFFPAMSVGYLLQAGVFALLFWFMAKPVWVENLPLLEKLYDMARQGILAPEKLSMTEQNGLVTLWLAVSGTLLCYGVFWVLTILWPAFVVYYQNNALKAHWRSLLQFCRDPLGMLAIIGLMFALQLLLTLATLTGVILQNAFIAIIFQFLGFMAGIYSMILVFVYVRQTFGKPLVPTEPVSSNDPRKEPPTA